jgi:hypothetical protein
MTNTERRKMIAEASKKLLLARQELSLAYREGDGDPDTGNPERMKTLRAAVEEASAELDEVQA